MDIADAQPLTPAVGTYPPEREQILEVSYELYHRKPWPWCKVAHIRRGLDAVREHHLAGFLALPINMGNNDRTETPEAGNLGRMNTWLLGKLLDDDPRDDASLVAAWLEEAFGGPQPRVVVEVLLEADDIADKGVQWGNGVSSRLSFESLHTTKLNWMFVGFIDPQFPYRMANPTLETLEALIVMKHDAHDRARRNLKRVQEESAGIHAALLEQLVKGYETLADYILLARDWHAYLLMQYAMERGLLKAERTTLARMSRYVEQFIASLARLRDTEAGHIALRGIAVPDVFTVEEGKSVVKG